MTLFDILASLDAREIPIVLLGPRSENLVALTLGNRHSNSLNWAGGRFSSLVDPSRCRVVSFVA